MKPFATGIKLSMLCMLYILTASCRNGNRQFAYECRNGQKGIIRMEHIHDSLYVLHHFINGVEQSSWELPYPVYRFDCGDLTGDSCPEIAVGVIKPTRYWPVPDKRLFLFKLYKGRLIRPLWLGSRVSLPLVDFHIVRDSVPMRICTTEQKPDGTFIKALYRKGGFGLVFERYLPE